MKMVERKWATLYKNLMKNLLYLMQQDSILCSTSLLSKLMHSPCIFTLVSKKWYWDRSKGLCTIELSMKRNVDAKLIGYCDIDWGSYKANMESTYSYMFSLRSGVFHGLQKNKR